MNDEKWKKLLLEFRSNVLYCEGTDFINDWRGLALEAGFTDEEADEVARLIEEQNKTL